MTTWELGKGLLGVIEHRHAAIPLLKTLVAGVLFHSCILGASHLVILISLIWTAPNGPYPFCSFASSVCVTLITPSSGLNKLLPVNQRHLVFMLPPLPLAGDVTIHLLMLVDLLSCWPWPIFGLPCRRVPTRSRNAERLGTGDIE